MAIESLVLGREKRSTAGNRMRALLDKAHSLETEEGFEEPEDDAEFQGFEEQDVFEEDFESTDEEEGGEGGDVDENAERALRREEKAASRSSRSSVNPTRPTQQYTSTGILKQQGYNLNSPEFSYLKKFGRKRESAGDGSRNRERAFETEKEKDRERRGSGLRREIKLGPDESGISEGASPSDPTVDQVQTPHNDVDRAIKRRRVSFHPGPERVSQLEGGMNEGAESNAVAGPSGTTSTVDDTNTISGDCSLDAPDGAQRNDIDTRQSPRSPSGRSRSRSHSESDASHSDSNSPNPNSNSNQTRRRTFYHHREGDLERKSTMRASTRAFKEEVDGRVEEGRRRVSTTVSRHTPRNTSTLTQGDYIALALETEEQNRDSLKDWLEKEEERKKLSRMERRIVAGPRISWVSRRIGGERDGGVEVDGDGGGTEVPTGSVDKGNGKEVFPSTSTSIEPCSDNARTSDCYTRNYVILAQIAGGQRGELRTLFGDQGEWTNMPHIPTKSRPMARRPITCPLTGLLAKYRHPTTNIPYATAAGYKTIDDLVKHRYTWSSQRRAYLVDAKEGKSSSADGMVEDGVQGWEEACGGWWSGMGEVAAERPETEAVLDADVVME